MQCPLRSRRARRGDHAVSAYWYWSASMNFWICAGVFSARNSRRFSGGKPKVSRPWRRDPLLDSPLVFEGKGATLLESLGNYIGVSSEGGFRVVGQLAAWPRTAASHAMGRKS